ncbi:unnamed protein product [Caenorhabditis angaria]|uniref:FYVE-type domain-containing protein n=1 Tax=Caenorhabditis angaria TaxID=860376 RepID=A0A9P1IHJ7_9PELO|nr:unnamed protein product [Caenorhabditis angaria]
MSDSEDRKSCEMCQNYELNLTIMQDNERKMKEELTAANSLAERYENDLTTEREYRKEMEKRVTEVAAQTSDNVKDCEKVNKQLELKLNELREKHEKSIEAFTEQLNNAHKLIQQGESEFAEFVGKYQKLLGENRKTAQDLRSEMIDLPAEVDQLQFLCLRNREELIEARAAKEHIEQNLKDEVAMVREQLKEERSARQSMERDLLGQINQLQKNLGIANSKLHSTSNAIAQQENSNRQIRDFQTTIAELEAQVQQVQNERAAVEITATNYKQRCSSLQQELDTSEAVQRDFVKLSQSLQIQLEKIRQSEQEVRWQFDEDVEKCSNCEVSVIKLKPKPHCLHCGKIFCAPCVKNTVPSGPHLKPANVCQVCHTLLNRDSKPFFATQDS